MMTISLTDGATTVQLPPDLFWSDEPWAPVEQTVQRTITGALVISNALRLSGRPITLEPDDESSAWTRRADLDQMRAWAAVPGKSLLLTLRGVVRPVVFRHQDGIAVDAKPIVHYSDTDGQDNYLATYRFMEI